MKRKVIQLAGKTLVVSLPTRWAQEQGIEKGDEVEVIEDGSFIQITKEIPTHLSKQAVDLDLSGKKEMAKRMVASLYKAGVDELRITYANSDELAKVKEVLLETCSGYEIYSQGQKTIEIKNISHLNEGEFDAFLKRAFHIMHTMADDAHKGLILKDKELLFDVFSRDLQVNKLLDLCRRLINKKAYKGKNPEALYFILEQLEKIADIYKDIGKKNSSKEFVYSSEVLLLLKDATTQFRMIHELFYVFTWEKMQEFRKKKDALTARIENGFETFVHSDLRLLSQIDLLVQQVYDMNGALIAYHAEF